MLFLVAALALQQAPPNPARDSTVAAINAVAMSVGQVKSGLDLLRRAAFNETSGRVLDRADFLRARCRAVLAEIDRSRRIACKDCLTAPRQQAVNAWLANLRSVAAMARRCDQQLERLAAGRNTDSAAARIKRQLGPIGNDITAALRPYEERVRQVRVSFGSVAEPRLRS